MPKRPVELAAFDGSGNEIAQWTARHGTLRGVVRELTKLDGDPALAAYRERGASFAIIVPGFATVWPSLAPSDPHVWLRAIDVTDMHWIPGDCTLRPGSFQRGDTAALRDSMAQMPCYGGCREAVTRD